jgi:MFS superfamily sulfate permease-like transporter
VAGFLISALGGSRTQIGGPTGAFVVIVAGIVAKFGLSGLFMVTMMAGVMLTVMGATFAAKLAAGRLAAEPPGDFDAIPIHTAIPGLRFPA